MRFYRNVTPNVDDLVMAKVIEYNDQFGYYCELLEYGNIRGFLSLSEIYNNRMTKKHPLNLGDMLPLTVLHVDNGIELSKKRVNSELSQKFVEKYKDANHITELIKDTYNIYKKLSDADNFIDIDNFFDKSIWKLYDNIHDLNKTNDENTNDDDHDNDDDNDDNSENNDDEINFQKIYSDIVDNIDLILRDIDTDSVLKYKINDILKSRIVRKNVVSEYEIYLLIFEEDAIPHIKKIFDFSGLKIDDKYKIEIQCTSPPQYKIKISGTDMSENDKIFDKILNHIQNYISTIESKFKIGNKNIVSRGEVSYKNISLHDLDKLC